MENSIRDGAAHLGFSPRRLSLAKAGCEQRTHRAVHPQGLLQALLRCHRAINRQLMRVRCTLMFSFRRDRHGRIKRNPEQRSSALVGRQTQTLFFRK
jgi:hypothetical protein